MIENGHIVNLAAERPVALTGRIVADPNVAVCIGLQQAAVLALPHQLSILVQKHPASVVYGCDEGPLADLQLAVGRDQLCCAAFGLHAESQPGCIPIGAGPSIQPW